MSTDNIQTIVNEPLHLVDDLQNLLEKQTRLARQGKIGDVELLSRQAGSIVARLAETGILELPEFENRRGQLQELYEQLRLTIAAQEADITEKLRQIGKAKKTVRAYRSNIQP